VHHDGHGGSFSALVTNSWVVLAVVLVALGAAALLVWLLMRGRSGASRSETAEGEALENLDGQIMAMLHQAGGAMTQVQIRNALDLPLDRVASVLRELEERGEVHRSWDTDRYTYSVSAAT